MINKAIEYTMINAFIAHAKNKAGKVTFVGWAARFNMSTGTLMVQTITHKTKSLLAKKTTAIKVSGTIVPIPPSKARPIQKSLDPSCLVHHAKNLFNKLSLVTSCVT